MLNAEETRNRDSASGIEQSTFGIQHSWIL